MDVYALTPVDKISAVVTSQSYIEDNKSLSPHELNNVKLKYLKKRKILAEELGITNKTKHKNIMYRSRIARYVYNHPKRDILKEYIFIGKEAFRLEKYMESLKIDKNISLDERR